MLAVGWQTYTGSLPVAWAFSQHDSLSCLRWWPRAPKVNVLKRQVGSEHHFYDLFCEVKLYHFCCI